MQTSAVHKNIGKQTEGWHPMTIHFCNELTETADKFDMDHDKVQVHLETCEHPECMSLCEERLKKLGYRKLEVHH